ncbi:MAG: hypothetical protein ACRDOO_17310 [Actinomadura sp.]
MRDWLIAGLVLAAMSVAFLWMAVRSRRSDLGEPGFRGISMPVTRSEESRRRARFGLWFAGLALLPVAAGFVIRGATSEIPGPVGVPLAVVLVAAVSWLVLLTLHDRRASKGR